MPKLGDIKPKAAPAKAKPKSTSSILTSNREVGLSRKRSVLLGPSGHGKTFTAMQLDPKFPKTLPNKKWLKLDKTIWVPFDDGALDGALEQKMEVPAVKVHEYLEEMDLLEALNQIGEDCHALAKPGLHFCVDTITALDKLICSYWNDEDNAPKTKGGDIDGFAVVRAINNTHMRFHQDMSALPCDVTFCAHTKPLGQSPTVKAKAQASALPGMADTVMDFVYYADANRYRQHISLICAIFEEPSKTDRTKVERWAYTRSHKGFEAKNRFQESLEPREKADLGAMYRKIEKNLKG